MRERSARRKTNRSHQPAGKLFAFPRRVWDLQISGMRRIALFGFLVGAILGCLFGAIVGGLPGQADKAGPEMLSVNQSTGKPQLHIKGKPEIK